MQSNKVLSQGRLVHSLIDRMFLLFHGSQAGGVDGVQAWIQLQGLIKLTETIGLLGGLEVPEPNRPMILEVIAVSF